MYSTMYADSALTAADTTLIAGMIGFFTTYSIFIIAIAVIGIIANWKIFSKAGKPGWASIVPIYNMVVQFQIVGLSPWLLLLFIVPIVNFIAIAVICIVIPFRMAKSFGKDLGWGFGLWLLPFIFNLILAFGPSEYIGPNGESTSEKVEAKVVDGE